MTRVERLGRWRTAVGVGLAIVSSAANVRAEDCPQAARLISESKALVGGDAEAKIQQATQLCPSLADAHYLLGKLQFEQGKFEAARGSFGRAVKGGNDPRFSLGLAGAEVASGNPAAGEKMYQELLSADANLVAAYSGLAVALRALARLSEAEGAIRRGVQITPQDAELFFNLGVLLEEQGKLDEAVEAYRASLERRKPFLNASVYLAQVLARLGNFDAALETVRSAKLLDPNSSDLLLAEAVALDGLGRSAEALERLDAAIAAGGQTEAVRINRAVALGKTGKVDQAITEISAIIAGNSSSAVALGVRGWLFLQQEEFSKAEADLRQAVELGVNAQPQAAGVTAVNALSSGSLAAAYRNLALALEQNGKNTEAATALQKSQELDTAGVLSKVPDRERVNERASQ